MMTKQIAERAIPQSNRAQAASASSPSGSTAASRSLDLPGLPIRSTT
jgi:hypothetical protein